MEAAAANVEAVVKACALDTAEPPLPEVREFANELVTWTMQTQPFTVHRLMMFIL